jgi:hypothetical protein
MEKFSVLPTEERFINLYEEQKLAIFVGLNNLPELNEMRIKIKNDQFVKSAMERPSIEFVDKNRIKNMKKYFLDKQNMTEEQAEIEIKKFCESAKKKEIERLKDLK